MVGASLMWGVLRGVPGRNVPFGPPRKKCQRAGVHGFGIKPDGRREILGFWLSGAEGESAKDWEDGLEDLWPRGIKKGEDFCSR